MKDNQAYVISIDTPLGECYLGERDGAMTKIRGSIFYHDEMYASAELARVIDKYKGSANTFLNNENNLHIKLVEISESDLGGMLPINDIRNKLTPLTHLVTLLESGVEFDKKHLDSALKQAKESINYLSKRNVY
jgi:hypothetical protein